MKRLQYILLLLAYVLVMSATHIHAEFNSKAPCKDIDLAWLNKHATIPNARIVSKQALDGLCEVILKIGKDYIPVYAGKTFILTGEMFKGKKAVTGPKIKAFKKADIRKNIQRLDRAAAFEYKPPVSKNRTIYMITDPLCGYCSYAAEHIKEIADKYGATVKAVLYPIHGDQAKCEGKAYDKSMEAICQKFDLDQYAAYDWKNAPVSEKYRCQKGKDLLAASADVIARLDIEGVPVFILDTGAKITGADMPALKRELEKAAKEHT
jgi:protein-disulfide isomerase